MTNNTIIKTTKQIYPQIYAYITPNYPANEGWVKIGYTNRQDVHIRIKEQTKTAAINLDYQLLWSAPAKFNQKTTTDNIWFNDKQLHAYLRQFKQIEQRPKSEWFFYNGTPQQSKQDFDDFISGNHTQIKQKLDYQLRKEQQDAVEQTLFYAKQTNEGEFLWNAKPRFGKTLTSYDLARRLEAKKVLIVTNRPAIANSWFDDFEKFIAWQTDYAFVSTSDSLKERPVLTRKQFLDQTSNGKKQMIAFISLQDLKGSIYFGGSHDKLKWVKDMPWDLLIIDEAHEGVDTLKTDVAFDNIQRKFTLHLSGTPFKALANNKFHAKEIFNWTYADEQLAKICWDSEEQNPYENLPKLNLFSYQMSQMITDEVNKGANIEGDNIDYTFDLNEFFSTNNNGEFIYEADVKKWLDTLTHNHKYPFSTKALRDELQHTFWLLDRVASAKALKKLLENHPVFENYTIVLAVGDGKNGQTDDNDIISQKSIDKVKDAIKHNDKTITLSVGQLTTGITIPEWTAVLMLSNLKSSSLYMQAAFRTQNPWEYQINGERHQKQNAYVFDFAPERTLVIYDEFANNLLTNTSGSNGTSEDRKNNIKQLLNFFPVIAEDSDGKMIELDVNQVLTLPKIFKSKEVVRRGFICNFLFQNISRIFASEKAREILEKIKPVDVGKSTPNKAQSPIDTQNINIDETGIAIVDNDIIISQTQAKFGEKVYGDIQLAVEKITKNINPTTLNTGKDLSQPIIKDLQQNLVIKAKQLAVENELKPKLAEKIIDQTTQKIAREIQIIQKNSETKQKIAQIEYEKIVEKAKSEPPQISQAKIEEAKNAYDEKNQKIVEELKQKITETVVNQSKKIAEQTTQTILQKAEDKKKNSTEDDTRGHLRGFARTIPSFLMAYGTPQTTLANFDTIIEDGVFKEVTSITLDEFRYLRDELNFFDETVFNQSVQEFLTKRNELANYFDETQEEDIFDYIPPQDTNQIYTPKWVVKMMIDKMENEDPTLFCQPDKTFADLYVKSGLYLAEIVKRLYKGLKTHIPDPNARLQHILENQIYGFAPSKIIHNIACNFVFGFDERANNIDQSHLVFLDTTPYAKNESDKSFKEKCDELFVGEKIMPFDTIVGNPPYQDNIEHREEQPAVYHYFYDLAKNVSKKYCLISPARFLFNVGATPNQWNEKMLNDKYLKVLFFEQNSAKVFPPPIDIKGGVAVLYRDKNKKFGAIETFTSYDELHTIMKKVVVGDFVSIGELLHSNTSYKYSDTLWEENKNLTTRVSGGSKRYLSSSAFDKLQEIFYDKKPNDKKEYIQILGRQNNERVFKWMRRDYLATHPNMDKYKVFVPSSNGTGAIGEVLSTPLIGQPLIGHTETFISFGAFDNALEADNCLKYIKTKFARVMLGIVKVTQGNKTKEVWSKVPLQDFTAHSDIDWTQSIADIDKQLYKKYGLSTDEINFIETKVKQMM